MRSRIWWGLVLGFTVNYLPHVVRFLRAPLSNPIATPHERELLSEVGIQSSTATSFLAWRRSALVVATVPVLVTAFVEVWELLTHLGRLERVPEEFQAILDGVGAIDPSLAGELAMFGEAALMPVLRFFEALKVGTAILAVVAAAAAIAALVHWRDHRRSRRRLVLAWGISLVKPLVIAIVPVRLLLGESPDMVGTVWMGKLTLTPEQMASVLQHVELEIGLAFAAYAVVSMAPVVLAVFPAIIRGGFHAKELLPESPIPGWVIAVTPPLYVISASSFFAILNQLGGSLLLLAGISALMLGPLVFPLTSRWLSRPTDPEHLRPRLRWIRGAGSLASLTAVACFAAYLLRLPLVAETNLISFRFVVRAGFETMGHYMTSTVAATDLVVWLMLVLRIQETHHVHTSPAIRASLDRRLEGIVELENPHRDEGTRRRERSDPAR